MPENETFTIKLTPTLLIHPKKGASENDFKIYACHTVDDRVEKNTYGNISIKGNMQRLELGVEYTAPVTLAEIHPKFGASYWCHDIYQEISETEDDQKAFLSYLLTENQVREIFKIYEGQNVIDLIANNKLDYKKIKGVGDSTYKKIRSKVLENLKDKELITKLGKYEITKNMIQELSEKYNNNFTLAVQKVEENPYVLTELHGVGFKKADTIARRMGFDFESPFRIQAGIEYTVEKNQNNGHTFMFYNDLINQGIEDLQVEENLIAKELKKTDGVIIVDDDKIITTKAHNAEKTIAIKLKSLMENKDELEFDPDDFIKEMEREHGIELTKQQRNLFENIHKYPINLLVGYAGVGKTMMQRLTTTLLNRLGKSYIILAPTAQAAKVSKEYTGEDAYTIHRAIGYGKKQNQKNSEAEAMYELDHDFIIIDEVSMCDVFITSMMLGKVVNPKARLLFCGDPKQLQSVGAGRVLHDMIECGYIPTTTLDIVFRQVEGGILDIATKVREGKKFMDDDFVGIKKFGNDLLIHCVEPSRRKEDSEYRMTEMEDGYKHYYDRVVKKWDSKDIMVLSPKKDGKLGVYAINKYIQSQVNPESEELNEFTYGKDEIIFRENDNVMNIKNKYDIFDYEDHLCDVINGDCGIIKQIVMDKTDENTRYRTDKDGNETEVDPRGLVVEFDDMTVQFKFSDLEFMIHNWSKTIHKVQGASSKVVILVLDQSTTFQLNANMIYTGITRTKEFCIILTQAKTFNRAIKKFENLSRQTLLQDFMKQVFEKEEVK